MSNTVERAKQIREQQKLESRREALKDEQSEQRRTEKNREYVKYIQESLDKIGVEDILNEVNSELLDGRASINRHFARVTHTSSYREHGEWYDESCTHTLSVMEMTWKKHTISVWMNGSIFINGVSFPEDEDKLVNLIHPELYSQSDGIFGGIEVRRRIEYDEDILVQVREQVEKQLAERLVEIVPSLVDKVS